MGDKNPLINDANAIAEGKKIYEMNCAACHGIDAKGDIGPSLTDTEWLYVAEPIGDDTLFTIVDRRDEQGSDHCKQKGQGRHASWGEFFGKKKIWSLVTYIRTLEEK